MTPKSQTLCLGWLRNTTQNIIFKHFIWGEAGDADKKENKQKNPKSKPYTLNKRLYEVFMIRVCHNSSPPAFENEEND